MTDTTIREESARSTERDAAAYDAAALQEKWLPVWDELAAVPRGRPDDNAPPQVRAGHVPVPLRRPAHGPRRGVRAGDVIARYWVQRGYNVLHPIGWDSFGLPAENAAIKRGAAPAAWTYENIEQQKASMRRYACSLRLGPRCCTPATPSTTAGTSGCSCASTSAAWPTARQSVNWCPNDQTVLANEQVVDGRCERCGTAVTKKKLTQWYFRITEYADRLLDDLAQLEGRWPDKVLTMQRNWIGRSDGRRRRLRDRGPRRARHRLHDPARHPVRRDVLRRRPRLRPGRGTGRGHAGARRSSTPTWSRCAGPTEIERLSTDRAKTGVFLHRYAINPVNGERLPIWAADYVLADYGHGAIMAVPAHDQRDLDFARAFDLPVRVVVDTGEEDPAGDRRRDGRRRRAGQLGPLDGLRKDEAIARIIEVLRERGHRRARRELPAARLADLAPAVLGHADPDHPLPGRRRGRRCPTTSCRCVLPTCRGPRPAAQGRRRRWARPTDWVNVDCPRCGGPAMRDTDTMDTFVDSSWYFLRFCSPQRRRRAVRRRRGARSGCRSTSTSAASRTRSCTCCTRGSSPRCCTTWAWSTSPSRSRGC